MRKITSLFFISLLTFNLYSEDSYQLGEGLKVGDLPIFVGGYFSIDYKHKRDFNRYRIDDIAFMSYGQKDKFSYMAEFEFKEFYVKTKEKGVSTIERDNKLHIERLYFDYALTDNYSFRIGKFNSPIGYWNLVPINVLRETTSSPISTYIIYPKFTTGAIVNYQNFDTDSYDVKFILQHNRDFDDEYNNYKIDEHYGVSLGFENYSFAMKFNSGYFHLNKEIKNSDRYYALLSAQIDRESYQLLGEIGTQYSDSHFTTPYALYLQGLYRFNEHNIGILRFESYRDKVSNRDDEIVVFGYTYRPLYPIALKAEYQLHSEQESNIILLSLSVLF